MWAQVLNGRVEEVKKETYPVAAPLEWVEIGDLKDQPKPGWDYKDGQFSPPLEKMAASEPCVCSLSLTNKAGDVRKRVYLSDDGKSLIFEDE